MPGDPPGPREQEPVPVALCSDRKYGSYSQDMDSRLCLFVTPASAYGSGAIQLIANWKSAEIALEDGALFSATSHAGQAKLDLSSIFTGHASSLDSTCSAPSSVIVGFPASIRRQGKYISLSSSLTVDADEGEGAGIDQ
jgi:hypothetical protein